MKPFNESIVFTDKFMRPVRKMLVGHRLEEMILLVTNVALYFLQRVKVKKQFEMQIIK
jgi:hypothetical protein